MGSERKYLKRALLASFAALWGGCADDSSTEVIALYGCGPCGCDSEKCEESSSSEQSISSDSQESEKSSSSFEIIDGPVLQDSVVDSPIALYGPPCIFDGSCLETSSSSTESSSSVDDGSSSSESFIDAPALYGPPCIFNNSCDTEFVEPEEKIEPENE